MLKKTAEELLDLEGTEFPVGAPALLVTEGDPAGVERHDAVVGDGGAEDVRGEVFQRGLATADGLDVDHPCFSPDMCRHLFEEFRLPEFITKLGSEYFRKRPLWNQIVLASDIPPFSVFGDSPAGDKHVDMRMIVKQACPGVEYSDHAKHAPYMTRIPAKFL